VIIILGIVVPTLLFARLDTIYIILMLIATVWLGIIGFIDDYLKLRAKRLAHEQGIAYKKEIKMDWQDGLRFLDKVGLGFFVGATLYFNADVRYGGNTRGYQ
jgi:phospho-N-acetylmuramoyl-pentapeptide-transferase